MPDIAGTADQSSGAATPAPDAALSDPTGPEPAGNDTAAGEPEATESTVDGVSAGSPSAEAAADPDAHAGEDRAPAGGDDRAPTTDQAPEADERALDAGEAPDADGQIPDADEAPDADGQIPDADEARDADERALDADEALDADGTAVDAVEVAPSADEAAVEVAHSAGAAAVDGGVVVPSAAAAAVEDGEAGSPEDGESGALRDEAAGGGAGPAEGGADDAPAGEENGAQSVLPGADQLRDTGELDELAAALDGGADEPRRHWLRYPGLFGALTVVALVILVPCGAGILFFTGAFADPGAYGHAPDACARLTAQRVRAAFGAGLVRDYPSDTGDESTCTYLGGAASGRNARVTLTLTRYGTKGPLSAPRMAHAGFRSDLSGTRHRTTLPGLGDEAVRVTSDTGTTVLVRRSNLVLRLDASGDIEDPSRGVTRTARALAGSLR
ncbi:hypothetical protein AB0I55_17615 [Actinocatenispora sera]|uniref:hypothetical protein n=1 Tax=Actinocatenispora sera TaxID=390989 RepID=UPI0033D8D6F3